MVNKKFFNRKNITIIIVIIIALGVISSVISKNESASTISNNSIQNTEPSPATSLETTEVTETEIVSEPNSIGLGETMSKKNYNITFDSIQSIQGNYFVQPDEGKEFVEVVLTIENTGSDTMSISSLLNFTGYFDDYSVEVELFSPSDSQSLNGEISTGKKLKGSIVFQAPINWSTFELEFQPELWGSSSSVSILKYQK